MTITFNFEYNNQYSTRIAYETKVTETTLGGEQRYPVKIYPFRYWTLNFNKNQASREDLEDFFVACLGQGNEFNFTWATAKGGDGKTYKCHIDSDEFKRTIVEMGYGQDMSLTFYTLDNGTYTPPANFDFYYKAKYDTLTTFNTLVDKAMTSHIKRRTLWTTPKKRWELEFEKTPANRKLIEAFFIAKRGKFKAFKWTWDSAKGGDDVEYDIRFDIDELDLDVLEMGYGTFKIPIKEVFPTDTDINIEKDEIIPRVMLEIVLDSGSIRILENDTLEKLTYGGQDYLGAPLELDDIKQSDNTEVLKIGANISNIDQAISGVISSSGDVITGATVNLYRVFLDTSTNTIISGSDEILLYGKANDLELNIESAKINIEIDLGGFEKSVPRLHYGVSCQYIKFKDVRCGYAGSATTCDRTLSTCKRLGNVENFGGYPNLPYESVIKA